jgi:homoserine/homoserine lactone efflux protein
MIEPSVLFAFIAASAALIVIPGPNVAVIVATGAAHGTRAALSVVAGTTLAQAAQIALVVLGMTALLSLFSGAFLVIKWLGIAYLVWLGVSALRAPAPGGGSQPASGQLFLRGAAIALANPKTMVFHAAFLPLFVDPSMAAGPQLFILAAVFLLIAIILDAGYAVAAGALAKVFSGDRFKKQTNRLSGVVMLVAAGWLALRREA